MHRTSSIPPALTPLSSSRSTFSLIISLGSELPPEQRIHIFSISAIKSSASGGDLSEVCRRDRDGVMLSPEELLGVFLTEGTLGSTSFAAGDSLSFGSRRRRLLTVGSISSFSSSGKSDGLNTVVLDCFVVVSLSKSLTGVSSTCIPSS